MFWRSLLIIFDPLFAILFVPAFFDFERLFFSFSSREIASSSNRTDSGFFFFELEVSFFFNADLFLFDGYLLDFYLSFDLDIFVLFDFSFSVIYGSFFDFFPF